MKTVISLIPTGEPMAMVQQKLEMAGFAESKIAFLFQPAAVWEQLDGFKKAQVVYKDMAIGALLGLVVGALYGIPAGFFNCLYGNCPVGVSLAFWIAISLYWVFAGGFLGALVGLDKLEFSLYSYVEGVRRGEALLMVESSEAQAADAVGILRDEYGSVIQIVELSAT